MVAWLLPAAIAAVSAAGSLIGGNQASKAMNRHKRGVLKQMDENEDWYNRRYNEDATQRADAVRVMEMLNDTIRQRNKARAGQQIVMGGNAASVAAGNEADSRATAEAAARIAAAGEARKDRIEESYRATKQNLQNQLNSIEAGKAQNTAQAIQGVTSAAGNALSALGSSGGSGDIWSKGGYKKYSPEMTWADSNLFPADMKSTEKIYKNLNNNYMAKIAQDRGW